MIAEHGNAQTQMRLPLGILATQLHHVMSTYLLVVHGPIEPMFWGQWRWRLLASSGSELCIESGKGIISAVDRPCASRR